MAQRTKTTASGGLLRQPVGIHAAFLHVVMAGHRVRAPSLRGAGVWIGIFRGFAEASAARGVQWEQVLEYIRLQAYIVFHLCIF